MKKIGYLSFIIIVMICVLFVSMTRKDIPIEELKEQYTNEHSKFMNIDGMDVHYRDEGKGFPLVLLHGISSSLNTWEEWTRQLKGNFRIIRLDLPGCALTGPNENRDYSIEFYVSFMKSFLHELKIDSCYMAGNSLGGYITWNIAAAYPNLVKKMILIDAAGYPIPSDSIPFMFKVALSPIIPLFKTVTPRFLVAQVIKQVYGDDTKITDAIIDQYYCLALRTGNRGAFLDIVKSLKFTQFDNLKIIKTPTLIMWGDKDIILEPKFARQFKADLSNSKLIMYPGVGHIPMEELPKKTADDAKLFLLGNGNDIE